MDSDTQTPTMSRSICDQCGKGFSNVYTLSAHKKIVHDGVKSFGCDICEIKFATKYKLHRHFLGVHSDKRDFHCANCGHSFKTRDMLVKHQRTHFEKGPFQCSVCDEIFKFKSGLDHHTSLKHRAHSEKEPGSKDVKNKPTVLYQCEKCQKLGKSMKWLERHEAFCHKLKEPLTCHKCPKTFEDPKNLEKHKKTHQQEAHFICSYCQKLYKSKSNFVVHIASHENRDDMKDYEFVIDPIIEEVYDEGEFIEVSSNEDDPEALLRKIDEDVVSIVKIETKRLVKGSTEEKSEVNETNQELGFESLDAESLDRNDYSEIVEGEIEDLDYLIDHDEKMYFYETIITEISESDAKENQEEIYVLEEVCSQSESGKNILEKSKQQKSERNKNTSKSICDECGAIFKNNSHMRRHVQRKHRKESYKFECEICGSRFVRENLKSLSMFPN